MGKPTKSDFALDLENRILHGMQENEIVNSQLEVVVGLIVDVLAGELYKLRYKEEMTQYENY